MSPLAAASEQKSHLSDDPEVNYARQLINQENYAAALPILRERLPAQQTAAHRVDVLFLIGWGALQWSEQSEGEQQQALLDEAIQALRLILTHNPGLLRVRLELARAFFLKGEDDLAKEHFELALAAHPPPAMATNIQVFLNAIKKRKRWNGYFSLALAPSNNVNSGSDRTQVSPDLMFTITPDSQAQSGVGLLISGGGNYQLPFVPNWSWRFGVDAQRSEYRKSNFDSMSLSLRGGLRYIPDAPWEMSAQLVGGRVWARTPQYDYYGGELSVERRLSQRLQVFASAAWRQRRYRTSGNRNGLYSDYQFGLTHYITPLLRLNSRAGFHTGRPSDRSSHSNQYSLRQSATMLLPNGWQTSGSVQWERTRFKSTSFSTEDREERRDEGRIFRLTLLNARFTIGGFSPQLALVRELRKSNFAFSHYKRYRGELYFVQQF